MAVSVERADSRTSFADRLREYRREQEATGWEGTLAQYIELVRRRPQINRLSHARIFDTILSAGTTELTTGKKQYNFFDRELFGLDETLLQLVDYFHSAAKRLEIRKRMLLFMGPVGGGKSTIVTILKRGLERYTKTDQGAIYAIKSCPMHEDPLHLIPHDLREAVMQDYGIDHIEGDLCPHCRHMVGEQYGGRIEDVRVEQITFSEKDRRGIGTFSPSDPKSQDITELTGSIDLARIGEYGVESDPRAYRFDGELNIANRGLMEFIEMLKSDEKFLYGLLTLTQEQSIKTGRFSMIYADEAIIAHTNEAEYTAFIGNKRMEALQDRVFLIKVPYVRKVADEERIYEKLIAQSDMGQVHLAPHMLFIASLWAVMSRLKPSQLLGLTDTPEHLRKKAKFLNGEQSVVEKQEAYDDVVQEGLTVSEGMDGISPRYVINCLSGALVKENVTCLTPIDAIRALRDGLSTHPTIQPQQKDQYLKLLDQSRQEYDELAKTDVLRAFVHDFEGAAVTTFEAYLDNAEAFVNKTRLEDPVTGERMGPDEKLMGSIEQRLGINESGKKAFREEVLTRMSRLARRGQPITWQFHEKLAQGIQLKLFEDIRNKAKLALGSKTPDKTQQDFMAEAQRQLTGSHGYCEHCAQELFKYVGTLLNK